ncbi:MAG: ADP-ribosylation factor-like protein [Myxococcales bacterium]|nr:ADP-ribosylation factor-like protein [Myxococcales bacterium]
MGIFDSSEQRIILRIVYDGPGYAGKSTNIRRLEGFFTRSRRSDVITPEEVEGRTRYFDWMQLEGGLIQGQRVRAQFVSVPGQVQLYRRRREALLTADAIVLVVDSSPAGIEEALEVVRSLPPLVEGQARPIVLQANKQDLDGALSPPQVREALGLPAEIPVVAGQAEQGVGVRETAVLAIRAAAEVVQREVIQHGLQSITGRAQGHQGLLMAMLDDLDTLLPPPPR